MEAWGELSPDAQKAAGTLPVSNWLVGPSMPTLPLYPSFLGADLAEKPQPCCRVRGALGCYRAGLRQSRTVPEQTDPKSLETLLTG